MIVDVFFLILSHLILIAVLIEMISKKNKSIANFIILIVYIFNVLPVLLDRIIGYPSYNEWFYNFDIAIRNSEVSLYYNLIILFLLLCLYIYSKAMKKKVVLTDRRVYSKHLNHLFIYSPFIFILLSGEISNYFVYGTYAARGLSGTHYYILSFLILISLYNFGKYYFFKADNQTINKSMTLFYFLSISWIDGKRYIIATLILYLGFIYFIKNKQKLKGVILKFSIIILLLLLFNNFYITIVKPIGGVTFEENYTSFRIDYGRDDVVKFVIYSEVINNNPILDYRGQSFVSSLFFWIPRSIWIDKPYPHYRYLTAKLYNIDSVLEIPSGMTPSIIEMFIANLGLLPGMILLMIFLLVIIRYADLMPDIHVKALLLLLLTITLTQGLDTLTPIFIILLIYILPRILKKAIHNNKYKKV